MTVPHGELTITGHLSFKKNLHKANSSLQKLVKSLSLTHGNADVERSLSANKRTVTSDRASLGDLTINDLRAVKDHVKVNGEPRNVQITKGLLQASREAHKASDEKEDMLKK